jgi:hypothetical protein
MTKNIKNIMMNFIIKIHKILKMINKMKYKVIILKVLNLLLALDGNDLTKLSTV